MNENKGKASLFVFLNFIKSMIISHPTLAISCIYFYLSLIGMWYSYLSLMQFNINAFDYLRISDFFLSAVKKQRIIFLTLLLLSVSTSLSFFLGRISGKIVPPRSTIFSKIKFMKAKNELERGKRQNIFWWFIFIFGVCLFLSIQYDMCITSAEMHYCELTGKTTESLKHGRSFYTYFYKSKDVIRSVNIHTSQPNSQIYNKVYIIESSSDYLFLYDRLDDKSFVIPKTQIYKIEY